MTKKSINETTENNYRLQTMKFLIGKPSLPHLISFGPKYLLRIPFSNILSLGSSLDVRHHVSQTYSTTGNIII